MNNDILHIVEIQDHYRNVEGLTSVDAFEEVIKIIFTKIYLENKKSKVDVESIKNTHILMKFVKSMIFLTVVILNQKT
jgi:hypothetical protein